MVITLLEKYHISVHLHDASKSGLVTALGVQPSHGVRRFYITLIVVKKIFKRFRDLFENPCIPQFRVGFQISTKGIKQYPRPH